MPTTKVENRTAFSFKKLGLHLLFWFAGLLLALCFILPIAAFVFFNPNDYKGEIVAFIHDKTGLPLEIEGNIELKIFPWVGLKVQDLKLAQIAEYGKGQFVQVGEIGFKIPLKALLRSQFKIESLLLKNIEINFIKSVNGSTNWETFLKNIIQSTKPTQSTIHLQPQDQAQKSLRADL